jgi:transaldolase
MTAHCGAPNPLRRLTELGQSVWIDWLSRDLLSSGGLRQLIAEHAVTGVTTNPTILERAIATGDGYDQQLGDLLAFDFSPREIATALARADVSEAAMELLPVWQATGGADGYVSWEVDPVFAQNPSATVNAVRELRELVDLPNLLVKIPATEPGLRALEDAIASGYSINVTLIFSLERYAAVVESYLRGLRRAADAGLDLASIHSVASLFVSRLDSAADGLLEQERSPFARSLRGRLGIATAKLAYRHFQACFTGARWEALRAHGAQPQRPLWASTSTKNPAYHDVRYVEELIGPQTVTTLPQATLDAFETHGRVAGDTLARGVEQAALTLGDLATAGLDLERLADELERDGVAHFTRSLAALESHIGSVQRHAKAA